MLYAFGGRNQAQGPLDKVEMFDTWHGRWVQRAPMPTRRAGSAAALLPDGRMMVIGGYNEKGIAEGLLASCDVYNPYKQAWEEGVPSLSRARWGHGCAPLRGKVYVVGGCSLQPDAQPREAFMQTLKCCEVYDPSTNRWMPSAPLQIARSGSRVVPLEGDRYLAAIGGCDDVFGRAETQPTVELFDVTTGVWSMLPARLAHPRTTAAAVAISPTHLLVVGGAPSLASAEVYQMVIPCDGADGAKKAIEDESAGRNGVAQTAPCMVADMPEGRMGCQAAVLMLPRPGRSYPLADSPCAVIVGGERCDEGGGDFPRVRQFQDVPVFDVETGDWREKGPVAPMDEPRTAVALCVGVGRIMSGDPDYEAGSPLWTACHGGMH